jgi:hypothetical protein
MIEQFVVRYAAEIVALGFLLIPPIIWWIERE